MAGKSEQKSDQIATVDVAAQLAERDKFHQQLTALSAGLIGRDLVTAEAADADGFDPVTMALEAIDARAEELRVIGRQLAAQKGAATRAKKAAATVIKAGKPREFGDVKDQPPPRELLELIAGADSVELAFFDRTGAEIEGIAPRAIDGPAWQATSSKLRLKGLELPVHGPAHGNSPFELAGYALLVDGEHVATEMRSDVLRIAAGVMVELKGDVSFG